MTSIKIRAVDTGKHLLSLVPLTIFLGLVISAGTILQYGLVATLNRPMATKADDDTGYLAISNLGTWAAESISISALIVGAIVAAVMRHKSRTMGQYLFVLVIALVGTQTLADIWFAILGDRFTVGEVLTAFVSNLIGFSILGVIVCGVIIAVEWFFANHDIGFSYAFEIFAFFLTAVIVSVIVFLISVLFFSLVTVYSDVRLGRKFSAWIATSEGDNFDLGKFETKPFEFEITSSHEPAKLQVLRQKGGQFEASAFAIEHCFDLDDARRLAQSLKTKPERVALNGIQFSGPKTFRIAGSAASASTKVRTDDVGMVWVDQTGKNGKVSSFSSNLKLERGESGDSWHFMQLSSVTSENGEPKLVDVKAGISFGTKTIPVTLHHSDITRDTRSKCKATPIDIVNADRISINALLGGVLLHLNDGSDDSDILNHSRQVKVWSNSGWLGLSANRSENADDGFSGHISSIMRATGTTELSVDGNTIKVRPYSTISAVGPLNITSTQEGFSVSGRSQQIWVDDTLLNKTNWAYVSETMKAVIFTCWVSLMGFIALKFNIVLKRSTKKRHVRLPSLLLARVRP